MADRKSSTISILITTLVLLGFTVLSISVANAQGLVLGSYNSSCPDAESIIYNVTAKYILNDSSYAPSLLRMIFHDCFVRGCEASVLLVPTEENNSTEMTYSGNLSLRGFNIIDDIKEQLEEVCPGIVSCADIIQLSGRDAVQLAYGKSWPVPTGRRDGNVSFASEAAKYLPAAYSNITTLKKNFAAVGLSVKDLVVLSSAHTVGISHCNSFVKRLYNYSGDGDEDPSLDSDYAATLKEKCPKNYSDDTVVYLDVVTPLKFDYKYFEAVTLKEGLLESDAALLDDDETSSYLKYQVTMNGSTWFEDFAQSMISMYQIGVLTGGAGEIRTKCGYANSDAYQ